MSEDGGKSFNLLKCLTKFSGRNDEYAEWKYTTRRTLGLYKPDINRILSGWKPEPKYEDLDDDQDSEEEAVGANELDNENVQHAQPHAQGANKEQDDDQEQIRELEEAEKHAAELDAAAKEAAQAVIDAEDQSQATTRAQITTRDTKAQLASQASKIVELLRAKLEQKPSAPTSSPTEEEPTHVSEPGRGTVSGSTARRATAATRRVIERVLVNEDELIAYEDADHQLFNILYLILTGAASYVVRKCAPIDGSSGSGIEVWNMLESKYQPADENRRRHLERELESATMQTGTDPDIFITHVWHLAEQIEFIGGTVTDEKRADIILQVCLRNTTSSGTMQQLTPDTTWTR